MLLFLLLLLLLVLSLYPLAASFWPLKLCCLFAGERDSASAELSIQTSELSSSHQQLTSELEDSRQQLGATQVELNRSAQAAESWQSQLAALQASSAAETASLRQQLTDAGEKSAEEEEKARAAQQDADKWRSQFEEVQASSKSAAAAAAQVRESECNSYCCLTEVGAVRLITMLFGWKLYCLTENILSGQKSCRLAEKCVIWLKIVLSG